MKLMTGNMKRGTASIVGAPMLMFMLMGIGLICPAYAAERADNRVIEEIIVTSTKRATGDLAQEVPVASTVLSASMILENNFNDIVDVAHMVPGADFRQTATFPGIQRFWLRAVGVSFSVPNFDPAVGVYQDGIFIAQNIAAILDTFDMESIEVLRGPQGTLFGRNTSVGAVVSRSRRPGDEFSFRARVTSGSFSRQDFSVSVEGPLIENKLLAKLSLQSRNRDGWMKDLSGGERLGEFESTHARGTLVWRPTDDLDVTLIGELYDRGGDGAVSTSLGESDLGRSGHPFVPDGRKWDTTYAGNAENEPWRSFSDHEVKKVIVEVNYDAGHGIFTSITGFVDVLAFSGGDFEGLPSGSPLNVVSRLMIDQDQFSQELRYASTFSEKYDFTAGLFYFTQDLFYGEQRCCQYSQPNVFGVRPPGVDELDHDSLGAFAEVRIKLSDVLTLSLGGRYTKEKKDVKIGFVNFGSCQAAVAPRFETSDYFVCTGGSAGGGYDYADDETWTSFSPKVSLQYQVTEDVMLYTSATRGFRSGGFSFRAGAGELLLRDAQIAAGVKPIRPTFYDEEQVDSVEIGIKSDWYENRLRFNATGYYNWWDGIQRNLQEGLPGNITQRTANVEESHVYGLEIEVNAIAGLDMFVEGDMLRIDGAFAVAESGYDSDDYVILDPDTLTVATDLTKQEFGAPHNTAFVAAIYEHPVGNQGATLSWRASYWWKDSNYNEGVQRANGLNKYEERSEYDAQVRYTSPDGKWYIKAFGKNLDYDKGYVARVPFAATWGLGNPREPRTYGITIGFES
jgi:iron complex outermembrane receptor protein